MHSLIFLTSLITFCAAQQLYSWPLKSSTNILPYNARAVAPNDLVLASNETSFVFILDCSYINSTYGSTCIEIFSFTPPLPYQNDPLTFGNVAAFAYNDYIIISNSVGELRTYYCISYTNCSLDNILQTNGNSDPTSITSSGSNFYAFYTELNYQGPAISIILCDNILLPNKSCFINQTLQSFSSDCLSVAPSDEQCIFDNSASPVSTISITDSILAVAFPQVGSGRGIVLIYDCSPLCSIQNIITNPIDYPFGADQFNQYFGSSVHSQLYAGDIYFVIGISNVANPIISYFSSSVMSNLYTGGAYIYKCFYSGPSIVCSYIEQMNNTYFINSAEHTCGGLNQNIGTSSAIIFPHIYISSPLYCSGAGIIYKLYCPLISTCNPSSVNFISSIGATPQDGFGAKILVSNNIIIGLTNTYSYVSLR